MNNISIIPTHFTCLPNEIVLIIFTYLTHAESIKSFGSIKHRRYIRLLENYSYKLIDFYTTSLSTFQLCCTSMINKFRLNVKILKLGHRDSYSQLRIFSQYCLTSSSLIDIFPQLETLVIRNIHESDSNELIPYLSVIPLIKKFVLNNCPLNKISKLICEHLLNNSINNRLTNCILHNTNVKDGIIITEPILSLYQSQQSLVYLRIDVRDFASLKHLLMFLPKLSTLDVHLGIDVTKNDQDLFPLSFNPCRYLNKLVLRLRHMVVQDIMSVIKFIRLFRSSLITLHLALIHQDPNVRHSLTYIDGDYLFKELVAPMIRMRELSFLIETTCLCNQQIDNIIRSFQTTYWSTLHIGCHYDSINCVYVIFTLPYIFDLQFLIMNDIINTKFNQTNDRLDCLIPMIFDKTPGVILLIGENESLSKSFIDMLKKSSHKGKSIKIKPDGIYQLQHNDHSFLQFDTLEIQRRYENQPSDGFINTTKTWFNYMPHIRILNIDNELLSQLIINKININQFSSLETLIVRQTKNSIIVEPLTIITHLGVSSSLSTIHIQQYRANSQLTNVDVIITIHKICQNIRKLKVMSIEFSKDALFNNRILENINDIQKKNCRLKYIHMSSDYIELWFNQ